MQQTTYDPHYHAWASTQWRAIANLQRQRAYARLLWRASFGDADGKPIQEGATR